MKVKRFLCFFLVFIFVFCSIPFSTSAVEIDFYGDIDNSSVETDLLRMGYNLEDYKKDVNADYCRFITFLEYGYEYDGTSEQYGLYIYLYNPSGKRINTSGMKITMQALGASNDENNGSGLMEHDLIFCDRSASSGYEYVFYKFKVGGATRIHSKLSRDMRHYQIESVSFTYFNETEKRVFEIGGRYSFIGYMPYCNKTKSYINSLQQFVTDVTAIDIELHPVTWKTKTSDKGAGYVYTMYSVYFAIPNDIIESYGYSNNVLTKGLKEIRGDFEEYKINGLITNDDDVYNTAYKYLNKYVVADGNSDIPLSFCTEYSGASSMGNYNYQGTNKYNMPYATKGYGDYINKYTSVFKYDYDTFSSFSSSEVNNLLNALWDKKGFMEMGEVDSGRVKGYQLYSVVAGDDLTSQIATYASNHSKIFSWLTGNSNLYLEDEVYEGAESIQALTYIDPNMSNADVAADLFIEESAVDPLKSFIAESNAKNSTTFIMRFAVRDYYCARAHIVANGKTYGSAEGNYYYEMTIFKNLDIFTFEFENKYEKATIIPVVAEPIDVIPSVDTTRDPDGDLGLGGIIPGFSGDPEDEGIKNLILSLFAIFSGLALAAVTLYVLNKLGFDVIGFFQSVFFYVEKFVKWLLKWINKGWNWLVSFLKKL